MASGIELPRRRDEEGDFHELLSTECPDCGCTVYQAEDDPGILWEPGTSWNDDCRDRVCHCHTEPLLGQRRG